MIHFSSNLEMFAQRLVYRKILAADEFLAIECLGQVDLLVIEHADTVPAEN